MLTNNIKSLIGKEVVMFDEGYGSCLVYGTIIGEQENSVWKNKFDLVVTWNKVEVDDKMLEARHRTKYFKEETREDYINSTLKFFNYYCNLVNKNLFKNNDGYKTFGFANTRYARHLKKLYLKKTQDSIKYYNKIYN